MLFGLHLCSNEQIQEFSRQKDGKVLKKFNKRNNENLTKKKLHPYSQVITECTE